MAGVRLAEVDKAYGPVTVIERLSLEIAAGEFMAFLRPSGCGKSTLLRMIAGSVELRGLGERRLTQAFELRHADLKAINSADAPDEVAPVAHPRAAFEPGMLKAVLKPLSWNVFVTTSG